MKLVFLFAALLSLVSCGRSLRGQQQFIPQREVNRDVNLDRAPPLPVLPGVEVRQVPSRASR